MVEDSTTFGLALAGVLAGLVVLIFGVLQNNGEELNAIILAGGLIVLLGFSVLTAGIARIETPEGGGH